MTRSTRLMILLATVSLIVAACSDDDATTSTEATAASTTSTSQATTTTAAETTTTAAETTTTTTTTTTAAPTAATVGATPVVGVLIPYSPNGGGLFPPNSVEAHWYQYEGSYVVLYRGFDAASGDPICAGNSIFEGSTWINISNSPHLGTADEICVGAPTIAESPAGAYACGSLLYYVTQIPTDTEGSLWGTLELGTTDGLEGQTTGPSGTPTDIANTPEFIPGQASYELPPSGVDAGGVVTCG